MFRRAHPDPARDPLALIWIPGGTFRIGSDRFYREERPERTAAAAGFWIERTPVTNAAFARFVAATGYVTLAERQPDPVLYPDADPALLAPGSLVFRAPARPVGLHDNRAWWEYVRGAQWRYPQGPGSDIGGLAEHPVVHVAYGDACAYAAWRGMSLPTEIEWERAARGGLDGATYAWGEEFAPGGRHMANTWQGRFPHENRGEDGYAGTAPVTAFPPNGYGVHDMIGNVWEWTATVFGPPGPAAKSCCSPAGGHGARTRRVVKGGSHLCAPNYCLRYRPSARQAEPEDTSTVHVGFRCMVRP